MESPVWLPLVMTLINVNVTFLALLYEIICHCLPLIYDGFTPLRVSARHRAHQCNTKYTLYSNIFLPSWALNPVPLSMQVC